MARVRLRPARLLAALPILAALAGCASAGPAAETPDMALEPVRVPETLHELPADECEVEDFDALLGTGESRFLRFDIVDRAPGVPDPGPPVRVPDSLE